MNYTPYTYYLYHRPTGKKYYGVRFKIGCDPSDLWKKYFSSSKDVWSLIEKYGIDSFDYSVRKTFKIKENAIDWEYRVLRRLKVCQSEIWLNKAVGRASPALGRKFNAKTKLKMSNSQSGKNNGFFGRRHTDEAKYKMSIARTGIKFSEERKAKHSLSRKGKPLIKLQGRVRDTNAVESTRIKNTGKKRSQEQIDRMRNAHLGKPLSEAHKQAMRDAHAGKQWSEKRRIAYENKKINKS